MWQLFFALLLSVPAAAQDDGPSPQDGAGPTEAPNASGPVDTPAAPAAGVPHDPEASAMDAMPLAGEPGDVSEVAPGRLAGGGFLIVVEDASQALFGATVALKVGEPGAIFPLSDDGSPPDIQAADAVFSGSGSVTAPGTQELVFLVDGAEQWRGTVEFTEDLSSPSLRATYADGALLGAGFLSDGPSGVVDQAERGPATGPGIVQLGDTSRDWLPVVLALGLLIGAAVGVTVRRRSRTPIIVSRFGAVKAIPWPGGWQEEVRSTVVLELPDQEARIEVVIALCRRLSRGVTVLLLSAPESRDSLAKGMPGTLVFQLDADRPTCAEIESGYKHLATLGPVVVVVEGFEALEPPDSDEMEDAVALEWLELLESLDAPGVILVRSGQSIVDEVPRVLVRTDGGYVHGERLELRRTPEGTLRWV